jgi:hypothetical protein
LLVAMIRILAFSPTTVILIAILIRIHFIRYVRSWSIVAFFSAFLIWLGIAGFLYALG